MRGPRSIIALSACALLALSPAAAAAAKGKKKPKKRPAPTVVQATKSSSSQNELLTISATCPKKTISTGGGFQTTVTQTGSSLDANIVYESKRQGTTGWTISFVRVDNAPAGNAMPATAYANCRSPQPAKRKKKAKGKAKPRKLALTEASAATSLTPGATATATARCPGGQSAVSGGFTTSPPPTTAPPSVVFVTESRRIGADSWSAGALAGNADPRTLTSFVYCAAGLGAKETSADGALPPSSPPATIASSTLTTAACTGTKRIASGGFLAPVDTSGPGSLPVVIESVAIGGSWRGTALNLALGQGRFTVFGYCL